MNKDGIDELIGAEPLHVASVNHDYTNAVLSADSIPY